MKTNKDKETENVILSPLALIGIVFVILKLGGALTWSWTATLVPFYLLILGCIIIDLSVNLKRWRK